MSTRERGSSGRPGVLDVPTGVGPASGDDRGAGEPQAQLRAFRAAQAVDERARRSSRASTARPSRVSTCTRSAGAACSPASSRKAAALRTAPRPTSARASSTKIVGPAGRVAGLAVEPGGERAVAAPVEHAGGPGGQRRALRRQQGGEHGVAGEGVAEAQPTVGDDEQPDVRRRPQRRDHRPLDLVGRPVTTSGRVGDRSQQPPVGVVDHRGGEHHLLRRRRQGGQPSRHEPRHRRRHPRRTDRQQLLDQQRQPVGAGDELLALGRGQRGAAAGRRQCGHALGVQAVQRQRADVGGEAREGGAGDVVAGRRHQQHGRVDQRAREVAHEVERVRVGPVQVLQHEQRGLPGQQRQHPLAEHDRGVGRAGVGRARERLVRDAGQQPAQRRAVGPQRGVVEGDARAQQPGQRLGHRPVGAAAVDRAPDQHRHACRGGPPAQLACEARLADARLAGDEQRAPLAAGGGVDEPERRGQLRPPPDQHRAAGGGHGHSLACPTPARQAPLSGRRPLGRLGSAPTSAPQAPLSSRRPSAAPARRCPRRARGPAGTALRCTSRRSGRLPPTRRRPPATRRPGRG